MSIKQQYETIRAVLNRVCIECNRNPNEVVLVAVSKTVGVEQVQGAIDAGGIDFGENRPEQLQIKHAAYPSMRWHFIGNVQSRRIPDIVSCASLVHSVYKPDHLAKFEKAAAQSEAGLVHILLEVNVSGEQSKGGITPDAAEELLREALAFPHVQVDGLMTMAPAGDKAIASDCFADLRLLRDALSHSVGTQLEHPLSQLSMGMSDDWREAVAQGSTMVRIGRAIFSEDFA